MTNSLIQNVQLKLLKAKHSINLYFMFMLNFPYSCEVNVHLETVSTMILRFEWQKLNNNI